MENNSSKSKYAKQNRYLNKNYDRPCIMMRKEWRIYEQIQKIMEQRDITFNAYVMNALVEQLKKEGHNIEPSLDEFLQKNYYKK